MTNHTYPKYNAAGERERNAVGARIAEARNAKNWNLGKLTEGLKACGVNLTKAAVNKWETGETVPNIYQFLAVTALLGMDDRLGSYREDASQELNQEGLRKLEEYRRDLVSSGNYRPAEKPKPVSQFREIAVAYMPAAAGTGNWLDDTEAYEMVSVPAQEIPKGAELGIRISGDSMEPVFHDGQIVWVQRCSQLNVGEVGIFSYDNQAYIKVYGEQPPEEDVRELYTDSYGAMRRQPVLHSYNSPKYSPIVISPYSPFRIFGRVLRA